MPRGAPPGERRGGRTKGIPNKLTPARKEDIRQIARGFIDDPVYLASLKARLEAGQANHMETLLWHYGHGRPAAETPEGGTTPTSITIHF
jgi:hypothetical protein